MISQIKCKIMVHFRLRYVCHIRLELLTIDIIITYKYFEKCIPLHIIKYKKIIIQFHRYTHTHKIILFAMTGNDLTLWIIKIITNMDNKYFDKCI